MRITIEIPDDLLKDVERIASNQGLTIEELAVAALQQAVAAEDAGRHPFRRDKRPFGGRGLQAGLLAADWNAIRRLSYGRRGG
jgi:hypothetical protein